MIKKRLVGALCSALIVMLVASGCAKEVTTDSGSSTDSTDDRITGLEQELQAAHKLSASLEDELRQLKDGPPPEVYRALATYVFNEFKRGKPPLELVEGETFTFLAGVKEGQKLYDVRRDEIDFKPITEWFKARPDTEVKSIEIWPQSTSGKVWMNIQTTDGFYMRVAFIDYRLRGFVTSEEPLPWE